MSERFVHVEREDGLAVLSFDRPPVNAIDLELVRQAGAALAEVSDEPEVRAVVLTGVGRSFSAGLDLRSVPSYSPDEQRAMIRELNQMLALLYGFPLPVVGAVNGHAIAGGLVIAIACDYRIGLEAGAQTGLTEARAGIPFPAGPMIVVRAELAPPIARRLVLGARNVDPDEALAAGILDELVPAEQVLQRAKEVASELGAAPRDAYARIKRQLRAEALRELERVVREDTDPLLNSWIGESGVTAAASLLRSVRDSD